MFAYLSRRRTRPCTTTRLRRIIAALAVVTAGLLAPTAAVPAAFAAVQVHTRPPRAAADTDPPADPAGTTMAPARPPPAARAPHHDPCPTPAPAAW